MLLLLAGSCCVASAQVPPAPEIDLATGGSALAWVAGPLLAITPLFFRNLNRDFATLVQSAFAQVKPIVANLRGN
jgi:hypothetical protein